jgi:hypothetical protein
MNSPENPELGQSARQEAKMDLALAWDVLKELGEAESPSRAPTGRP